MIRRIAIGAVFVAIYVLMRMAGYSHDGITFGWLILLLVEWFDRKLNEVMP